MCRHLRRTRIRAALGIVYLVAAISAARAQTTPAPAVNCTDVQVGSAQSYACINAQLGNVAERATASVLVDGRTDFGRLAWLRYRNV